MNGIDKITDKIEGEAGLEARRILEEAEAEAAKVIDGFKSKAESAVNAIIEAGKKAAEDRQRKFPAAAALEGKKALLAKKQDLMAKAFDKALEKLCALPEEEYVALMARLAANAAESGDEELIFSPADRARLGKKVAEAANKLLADQGRNAALTLSADTRPMKAGVIVAKGDVEVNCAFETVVRMERDALSADVSRALFG